MSPTMYPHDNVIVLKSIGSSQNTVNNIIRFTENVQMELSAKKCNEIIVDVRKNKTVIPSVCNSHATTYGWSENVEAFGTLDEYKSKKTEFSCFMND